MIDFLSFVWSACALMGYGEIERMLEEWVEKFQNLESRRGVSAGG